MSNLHEKLIYIMLQPFLTRKSTGGIVNSKNYAKQKFMQKTKKKLALKRKPANFDIPFKILQGWVALRYLLG